MELYPTDGVVRSALNTTNLAILTIDSTGALVTSLKPSNEKEKESLDKVVMSLAFVVKGKTKEVDISAGLRDYLKTFDAKPLHPVTPLTSGGEFAGRIPSRIYNAAGALNGDAFIVVEAAPRGFFVSLFPVVPSS